MQKYKNTLLMMTLLALFCLVFLFFCLFVFSNAMLVALLVSVVLVATTIVPEIQKYEFIHLQQLNFAKYCGIISTGTAGSWFAKQKKVSV